MDVTLLPDRNKELSKCTLSRRRNQVQSKRECRVASVLSDFFCHFFFVIASERDGILALKRRSGLLRTRKYSKGAKNLHDGYTRLHVRSTTVLLPPELGSVLFAGLHSLCICRVKGFSGDRRSLPTGRSLALVCVCVFARLSPKPTLALILSSSHLSRGRAIFTLPPGYVRASLPRRVKRAIN